MASNRPQVRNIRGLAVALSLGLAVPASQALTWQSVVEFLATMRSELSAWSVATKQTAVAAHQQAMSVQVSQQQLANAMGAISMSQRVSAALVSVAPTLGQPVTIKCEAQKDAALQVEAWHQVTHDRSRLMATFAGTRVSTSARADAERVALHKESYCTVSEAKAGMCALKANGMQGWDVNYGGPFSERTLPAEGELAGYAYAAMVADTRAPATADCRSSACAAAGAEQLAVAAAGTLVADSLLGQVLERRIPVLTGK